jgi:kynureninase
LINAEQKNICPQPNLASGFSAFLSAIAKLPAHKHQNTIVMHEEAFASMGFVVTALTKTYGLRLVLIKDCPNNIDAWMEAFEQHSVLACLVTHVHSNTSLKSDVSPICSMARQFEAFALVDIAQSVGITPVDVKYWQADAVFGSCVKWLCGGPGAGFMYVKDALLESLQPDPVGWFSHQNPFEFNIENFVFADTAMRFWGGTPSIAPYVMACASIKLMRQLGIDNIVRRNRSLKETLLQALPQTHPSKDLLDVYKDQGGTLCLRPLDYDKTVSTLTTNKIQHDQRGDIFRISLHVMNTEDEARRIAECFV